MTKITETRSKRRLILASASAYRRRLLQRLGLNFTVQAADIDESRQADESAQTQVTRLARGKAVAIANKLQSNEKNVVIIGSDQVAVHNEQILGKPGDAKNACEQLARFSGSMVQFLTAVCVLDVANNILHEHTDETQVYFRKLSNSEIESYVDREQPFDCAGGFKAESLGIVLFSQIDCSDPTGLLGLPLIWVTQALRACGIKTLAD